MVWENNVMEKETNGVAFIKFINSSDFMNKEAEIQNWGSADYSEWNEYWSDYH